MSVLGFPRVHFKGIFRANPCTSNNDDVMPDAVQRDSDTLGSDLAGLSDDQITALLRATVTRTNGASPPWPCNTFVNAGWNLYGDHSAVFDDAVVTSVVSGPTPAERTTTAAEDPLIGQAVQILGSASSDPMRRGAAILCDLDYTGLVTTQLFVGGLQIGSASGSAAPALLLDHDTRGYQDWLNFQSTVSAAQYGGDQNFVGIGCVWQFGIPASVLPDTVSLASSGLNSLLTAARQAAGLLVRFRCFEVEPQITDANLAAAFAQGQGPDNPAVGYLVGTIGVWGIGEPETEVAGRKLMCPWPRPAMTWTGSGNATHTVAASTSPWNCEPSLAGNAVAFVQPTGSYVSLDLINALPKFGYRNPDGPQKPTSGGFAAARSKADVGALVLGVQPPSGGPVTTIGTVDYGLSDYATYEDFGGIVDIPYDQTVASAIEAGTLVLQGASSGTVNQAVTLLVESPIRVVTDDRTKYWVAGQGAASIRLKLYERGNRTTSPTTVYLSEYVNVIASQEPVTGCPARPNQTVQARNGGNLLAFPSSVVIPAGAGFDDWFEIAVTPVTGGATILSYQLSSSVYGGGPGQICGVPVWTYADYTTVRVYPDQDYASLYANGPLKWDDVYQTALRYYYVLFPAMSRYIPLNSSDTIVQAGPLILERLNTPDVPAFYSTSNMPITRAMSPAKVKLVKDFITQQLGRSGT